MEAARRADMKAIGITTVNSAEELLKLDAVVEAHANFREMSPERLVEQYLADRATAVEG
jgi:beta-phosphoglucomutase-like phosphatase (HAD superfamily)